MCVSTQLHRCAWVSPSFYLTLSLTLRGYLCIAEWNDIWNMCQVPLHLLMLPDMTPTRSTREVCTNVPNVRMYICMWALVCVSVCGFWYFLLLGYHLGFLGRHSPSSWGNSWNVFVDKHGHESLHVSSEGSELAKCLCFASFAYVCVCIYVCGYMYCTHVYVVHYSVLCSLLLLLFFGFLLRFLWFVCDFHASFRLVCVRSLLGYASNMHTDTHTHTHTRTQSYVLISCPFSSLFLSLSFAQFAWCELWLRFGTCPSLHAHLFFLLLLFVSLF